MSRIESCKQMFEKLTRHGTGYNRNMEKANLISIREGACTVEITIGEEHTNMFGWMHGALAATMFDCFTSLALMTKHTGFIASVDIHLSYLKGAKINDVVVIEAEVVNLGLTLAYVEATIKNKAGNILVKGTHTLYLGK